MTCLARSTHHAQLACALLFAIMAGLGAPTIASAQLAPPATIIGINPTDADLGEVVRIRTSFKMPDSFTVLVGGVPAQAAVENDRQWIEFKVPLTLTPGREVPVALVIDRKTSTGKLNLKPLRIITVTPNPVQAGGDIKIVFAPGLELLNTTLALGNGGLTLPFRQTTLTELGATLPRELTAGAMTLQLKRALGASIPFTGLIITETPRSYTTFIIGALIVALVVLARAFVKKSSFVAADTDEPELTPDAVEAGAALNVPPLELPPELVTALAEGQCVLFAGAGLSARAGLPTWPKFVTHLLAWAQNEQLIDAAFGSSLVQAIQRGAYDRVADSIISSVVERNAIERLRAELERMFRDRAPADAHRALKRLGFAAALTTNLDTLLEQTFDQGTPLVPADLPRLRAALADRQFFLLKLYGDLKQPDSLLIAPAQYQERIRNDRRFADFMQQLFHSRTLLFLGSSFAGIEAYLAPLGLRPPSPGIVRHFAVMAVDAPGWEADADALQRRYGIRVLPYVATARHQEVVAFVESLRQRLAESAAQRTAPATEPDQEQDAVLLKGIELSNIGPFEHLTLTFTRRWTVLLGDNGVGKSSVLRAIAAAVAGDAAGAIGGRLLRAGQTEGEISLTTRSGDRYGARVFLDSLGKPVLQAIGPSGLGGSTLVLAFPPIRTIGPTQIGTPQVKEWTQPPTSDDVLPALTAMPDPRILDFKQWLVNLDYARSKNTAVAPRVNAVFTALAGALGQMLGGLKLDGLRVVDNDVVVDADDGVLSLDKLSQGTLSMLGWVGVLIQRLHEVSQGGPQRALVLVDEIDAHMHPEWQQAIIARLVEAFPLVQFIVSTHSPFLAIGRQADEIVRFRRDPVTRQVRAELADRDTKGMTVSDVLTSYLFGLQSPVDPALQERVLKLRELSIKPELSDPEVQELRELEQELGPVGIADTKADPLYGQFLEELSRQRGQAIANLPPMSKEATARQRELTQQLAAKVRERATARAPEKQP